MRQRDVFACRYHYLNIDTRVGDGSSYLSISPDFEWSRAVSRRLPFYPAPLMPHGFASRPLTPHRFDKDPFNKISRQYKHAPGNRRNPSALPGFRFETFHGVSAVDSRALASCMIKSWNNSRRSIRETDQFPLHAFEFSADFARGPERNVAIPRDRAGPVFRRCQNERPRAKGFEV